MTTTSGHPAGTAVRAAAVPARLRPGDLAGLAAVGLRTRKLRAGLSALGIAIGVAAVVAVLGLAASSQAALLAEISRLGTNLLTVTNGQTFSGATAELPVAAPGMITRLPGVTAVQDTGTVSGISVYKSPYIPAIETNGLSVDAVTLGLPAVAGTSLAQGRFLDAATASYARSHHELLVIPAQAWVGGLAAAVVIGALAGLLPAIRAARLSPTQALWSV